LTTLIILWILYGVFKGFQDAIRDGETVFRYWLATKSERWMRWYNGGENGCGLFTKKISQGYHWSADAWHEFDLWRNTVAAASMAYAPFALQGWLWWHVLLLTWFCYWIPSFTLVYHVVLMRDWTLKKWLINNLQIWK
jgi:hypothetical protein